MKQILDDDMLHEGDSDPEYASGPLAAERNKLLRHIRISRLAVVFSAAIAAILLLGITVGRGDTTNDRLGEAFLDTLGWLFGTHTIVLAVCAWFAMRWPAWCFGTSILSFSLLYLRVARDMPAFLHLLPFLVLFFLFRGLFNALKLNKLETATFGSK